ncbi:hypothetical protein [Pantoea ananatis]|uniref:hypothetical protein n=1 Tax=Pantoea ananas TaxID=553 RepID=UPI000CF4AF87|nr:hypothetical protein [Pantoea ananatis]PQL04877.1 hypothetical protein CG434_02835 [Pantoea ananatis]
MIKLPDAKETKFVYHGGNGAFDCGYESGWNAAIAEVQRLNATAQPVSDGLYRIANHIARAKNSLPQEWQDWAEEIESDLRKLSTAKGGQDG